MKGIVEFKVEIDYAEIVKSEHIQGIHAFTGFNSVEDIMNAHFNQVVQNLTNSIKHLPNVVYEARGGLVEPEANKDATVEAVESVDTVETLEEMAESVSEGSVEDRLASDLEKVSAEMGIPTKVILNDESFDAMSGCKLKSFMGFPVEREGMDSPYVIAYKPYSGDRELMYFDPLAKELEK